MDDIVAECRELVRQGVREITLLGQIVTSYGRRDYPHRDGVSPFVQLLERVHEIDGLARLRFTSPHPRGFKDDLVAAYLQRRADHAGAFGHGFEFSLCPASGTGAGTRGVGDREIACRNGQA